MISHLMLTAAFAAVPMAHPLGNFSVNSLVELTLRPDRVNAVAIVDLAELPTLQLTPSCEDFASALAVRVNGAALRWTIQSRQLEQPDGAAGLKTTRLACDLTAPAELDSAATVTVANGYLAGRVGWHEITARGDGVNLQTDLPSRSATDGLRNYPTDPLSTPTQVRQTSFGTTAGVDAQRSAGAAITGDGSLLKRAETWLTNTIGDPTPVVGLLAVLLSVVLGAAHAALPGHGKTVIAVYMAGRKGRRRDALYVGATVTLTHTAGVLILGIGLTAVASLAAEAVLAWLGIVSGAVMLTVGVGMLYTSLRQRRARAVAAAHAETSAARWLDIARWHDVNHGVGIMRPAKTINTFDVDRADDIDGNDGHAAASTHAPHALAVSHHGAAPAVSHHGAALVWRAAPADGHKHDHDHDHDHDHGHGHHHHGHHHHHHSHGHGHEHGHSHGFWGGHRHSHGRDHNYDDDHNHDNGNDNPANSNDVQIGGHRQKYPHGHGFSRGFLHGHGGKRGFWHNLRHGHSHDHSHSRDHSHGYEPGPGRASLTLLGIAGGLVPSPTALVVLLGAVALGRTWFGIMLIVAYGVGMAGTLTAAGLLLVRLRDRWSWLNKLSIPPMATGSLIIAVGLGLAVRAALTI